LIELVTEILEGPFVTDLLQRQHVGVELLNRVGQVLDLCIVGRRALTRFGAKKVLDVPRHELERHGSSSQNERSNAALPRYVNDDFFERMRARLCVAIALDMTPFLCKM
jgi:hypothetical protein